MAAVSAIAIRRVRSAVIIMSAVWWDGTMIVSATAIRRVRLAVLLLSAVWWDITYTVVSATAIRRVQSAVGSVCRRSGGRNIGSISDCYSTGSVSGTTNVSGLVENNDGIIVSSFWDTNSSGQTTSAGGTGMTTAQMQTLSTFTSAGWDFTNETANGTNDYWRMCVDGVNYPQLNWESDQPAISLVRMASISKTSLLCRAMAGKRLHLIQ